MSSAALHETLTSANITMLSRALDTAGIFDIRTQWHSERRLKFGRLLIEAFQEGMTSESQLVEMVVSNIEMLHPSCLPEELSDSSKDISRWENEGGHPNFSTENDSGLFGKWLKSDDIPKIHRDVASSVAASAKVPKRIVSRQVV